MKNYLVEFQKKLKAPKGQFNNFGKYKYRSCEDIIESVKPIIHEAGFSLTLSDEVVQVSDRVYVKATARLIGFIDSEAVEYTTTAYAREELDKKGMDSSQITGAASSYARKYALNGLFAIDDTKDSDATNTHGKEEKEVQELPWMNDKQFHSTIQRIQSGEFGEFETVEKFMQKVFESYRIKSEYRKAIDEELQSIFNSKVNG